jgi:hypothetical protein
MKEIKEKLDNPTSTKKNKQRLINVTLPLHPDSLKDVEYLIDKSNEKLEDGDIGYSKTEILRYAVEFSFGNPRFRSMIKNRSI